ncbi:transcription factor EGL1-like [Impatiens glandulifera]|uniref:transcription factor EGL1-like n=1 Tax=Impatiens glandulifera TaxID=253017 RepID=UPI001FB0E4EC|nr:transcription factor EGL1-like [Impatiens glandulifera]
MAAAGDNHNGLMPENLKTQLAIAIRSIRWSYAIFWSISQSDEGVLEWREGYYNGDIKTRKTIQVANFDSDQLGLLRSEQLRELYGSLSDSETNLQTRRPTAALSPEDLTDTEWYYLVCMSFMFDIGQGLPGRTFANGQFIWLSDAPFADSKIFNRSLLAKSASIQTVVCFPYLGGVIEMGVTELVEEDPGFIEHVITSYLTNPSVSFSMIPTSFSGNGGRNDENDHVFDDLIDTDLNLTDEWDPITSDSFLVDHDLREEFSNCIMQNATSSSECISHTLLNTCGWSSPGKRKANDECLIDEIEQHDRTIKRSNSCSILDIQTEDDSHYGVVVASLLKSSNSFLLGTPLRKLENQESSFVGWRKNSPVQPRKGNPQRLLKKILIEVPRMSRGCLLDSKKKEGQHDVVDSNHTLSERRRRERISERFSVLGSLIPSIKKVDKVSILDTTIEYVMGLERRVAELESCSDAGFGELNAKTITKRKNVITSDERISNNIGKHLSTNKRKSTILNESGLDGKLANNSTDKVKVIVDENDVIIIEIRCLWRESLLLDIMDAMGRICLDSHSVQSNNVDGFLDITIKSKFKGSASGSAGMVTEAVQRVVWKN